jgi:hypothetical protein
MTSDPVDSSSVRGLLAVDDVCCHCILAFAWRLVPEWVAQVLSPSALFVGAVDVDTSLQVFKGLPLGRCTAVALMLSTQCLVFLCVAPARSVSMEELSPVQGRILVYPLFPSSCERYEGHPHNAFQGG